MSRTALFDRSLEAFGRYWRVLVWRPGFGTRWPTLGRWQSRDCFVLWIGLLWVETGRVNFRTGTNCQNCERWIEFGEDCAICATCDAMRCEACREDECLSPECAVERAYAREESSYA